MKKLIIALITLTFILTGLSCVCAENIDNFNLNIQDFDYNHYINLDNPNDEIPDVVTDNIDIDDEDTVFDLYLEYVLGTNKTPEENVDAIAQHFNVNNDDAKVIYHFLWNKAEKDGVL